MRRVPAFVVAQITWAMVLVTVWVGVLLALPLDPDYTAGELLDPALPPEQLLFRLFHEEGVRAYKPHALKASCRCSRERVENMLKALGPGEIEDLKVDGKLAVTCEFCSAVYVFAEEDIAALAPR